MRQHVFELRYRPLKPIIYGDAAEEFGQRIYFAITDKIKEMLTTKPEHGVARRIWFHGNLHSDENFFIFRFMDNYPVLAEAGLHWFLLITAEIQDDLDKIAEKMGFEILEPRDDPQDLICSNMGFQPIFNLNDQLYLVRVTGSGEMEVVGRKVADLQQFSKGELVRIKRISETKICECSICHKLREKYQDIPVLEIIEE